MRNSFSIMVKYPVMTWLEGPYLNGELWQEQSGGIIQSWSPQSWGPKTPFCSWKVFMQ